MIESFSFDHTKIERVPYVRLAKQIEIAPGAVLKKFDIRFTMPNRAYLDMPVMHAIEHILSGELDRWCEGENFTYVDFSPMGCQTGFYLSVIVKTADAANEAAVCGTMDGACNRLTGYTEVPHANETDCGNYRSFDLPKAREICAGISFLPFEKAARAV